MVLTATWLTRFQGRALSNLGCPRLFADKPAADLWGLFWALSCNLPKSGVSLRGPPEILAPSLGLVNCHAGPPR